MMQFFKGKMKIHMYCTHSAAAYFMSKFTLVFLFQWNVYRKGFLGRAYVLKIKPIFDAPFTKNNVKNILSNSN